MGNIIPCKLFTYIVLHHMVKLIEQNSVTHFLVLDFKESLLLPQPVIS